MQSRFKLVAFDMDGTLIRERSSWNTIHKHFGTTRLAKQALQQYLGGKIDYSEFMRRDIAVWPKPLHIHEIERILEAYTLQPSARSTVSRLSRLGIESAVITAGLNTLAKKVASTLGIHHIAANELHVNSQGFLTGNGRMRVDPLRKEVALGEMASSLGFGLEECVSVGDSRIDASFLQAAGMGLLLGSKKLAREVGVRRISSLHSILALV